MGKGIWVDGNASEEELEKLKELFKEAITRARSGTLPMKFVDDKITFEARTVKNAIVASYGWNYPPKELWVKEEKDIEECVYCFPNGPQREPGREVWCHKLGYHFPKCPYGVKTKVTLVGG